jgi:hypothetical protein
MYYRVYDGVECKDGGADDITESSNDINGTYYLYTSGLVASTLTPWDSNPATSGSGERDAHLHLSIEGANIAGSPIYGESTGTVLKSQRKSDSASAIVCGTIILTMTTLSK